MGKDFHGKGSSDSPAVRPSKSRGGIARGGEANSLVTNTRFWLLSSNSFILPHRLLRQRLRKWGQWFPGGNRIVLLHRCIPFTLRNTSQTWSRYVFSVVHSTGRSPLSSPGTVCQPVIKVQCEEGSRHGDFRASWSGVACFSRFRC